MILLDPESVMVRVENTATDDFLTKLVDIARIYGWSGDYIEVENFIEFTYNARGLKMPDVTPYESDVNDNLIIP